MTDTTPPQLLSLSPSDNATEVEASTEFILTFDEPVMAGSGLIYGDVALTGNGFMIPITDTSQVTFDANTVRFKPSVTTLDYQDYTIRILSSAIKDLSGNSFSGLNTLTDWNFSVARPTYQLFSHATEVNEGESVRFELVTTHVPEGREVYISVGMENPYSADSYQGFNALDVSGGGAYRRVTVGADGRAVFDVQFLRDERTEGIEQAYVYVTESATTAPCSVTVHDTSVLTVGQPVIDLGWAGKLIHPVRVDGNHYFYYWDVSGDGSSNPDGPAGPNNDGRDDISVEYLQSVFCHSLDDAGGTSVGGQIITPNTRYAWLSGVHVALPLVGAGVDGTSSSNGWLAQGTTVGATEAAQGDVSVNPIYDDLLAIWDAYNGVGNGQSSALPDGWLNGTPTGWNGSFFSANYVTGNVVSPGGYQVVNLVDGSIRLASNGVGNFSNTTYEARVVVEVLFPDATPPQVLDVTPANLATGVAVGANVVIHFGESIRRSAGLITLKTTSGTTVATYGLDSPQVTVVGNEITIDPSEDLSPGTNYQIDFATGAIQDMAGNDIVDFPAYQFRTHSVYVPGTVPKAKFWNSNDRLSSEKGIQSSISLKDVLEALKLYLHKPIANLSPYSYVAADLNGNGSVDLSDVLGILKCYLGKQGAVMPQWVFLDKTEIDAYAHTIIASACEVTPVPFAQVEDSRAELVGVLRGDVDGSWAG
jgi:methionine-rich copper-binding protein CopC